MKNSLKWGIPILFLLAACQGSLLPNLPDDDTVLDGPIPGLTEAELNQHSLGDLAFGRVFGETEGLGPIFVSNACITCHQGDGKGHPFTTLTRFGKMTASGFDPMIAEGGPQLQPFAISNYPGEYIPSGATGVAKFMAPAVTGLGLVELVSDADILTYADPQDSNGDGISGVASYIEAPDYFQPKPWHIPVNGKYIGRFGRKAGAIDLTHQTVSAYFNDMGISSEFHPEDVYNIQSGIFSGDNAPEPEVSLAELNQVVFYLQTLKVPPRRNAEDAAIQSGENIFLTTGCASCHRPEMKTQSSPVIVLSEKTFYPYSDFLLHDLGTGLDDGYTEGSATTSEWRTTPLWGLGLSASTQGNTARYLHDGRAKTLTEAIHLHGGEGAKSRENFQNLTASDQELLLQFLESL